MSRTLQIAIHEGRIAFRGRGAWLLLGLSALLSLLMVIDSAQRVQRERTEHREASAAMHDFWLHQGQANPHSATHFGIFLFQPRAALSFFDEGHLPYLPTTVLAESHKQNLLGFRPASASASGDLLSMSPAGILQVLMPLIIILLSFSSVSGERERGTLRAVLASGATASEILLGKVLGLFALVLLAVAPLVLPLGFAASWLGFSLEEVVTLGQLLLLYLLWLLFWVMLGVTASTIARSSSAALFVLLGLWAFQVALLPRIASFAASQWAPLTSKQEMLTTLKKELSDGAEQRAEALKEETLKRYNVKSVEALPFNFDALAMQADEEHSHQIFDAQFGAMFAQLKAQEEIALGFGVLSPMQLICHTSRRLTRSDLAYHQEFVAAAEQYRREMVKQMNQIMMERSRTGDWKFTVGEEVWALVPPFSFDAKTPQPVASMMGLFAWVMLSFLTLRASARRVRP